MTVVNGHLRVDASELGPAVQKLLDLLDERKLPISISRDGKPLAEVIPSPVLAAPDPKLRVTLRVSPDQITLPEDWSEAVG